MALPLKTPGGMLLFRIGGQPGIDHNKLVSDSFVLQLPTDHNGRVSATADEVQAAIDELPAAVNRTEEPMTDPTLVYARQLGGTFLRQLAEEAAARALEPLLERCGVLPQLRQLQDLRLVQGLQAMLPGDPVRAVDAGAFERMVQLQRAPVARPAPRKPWARLLCRRLLGYRLSVSLERS